MSRPQKFRAWDKITERFYPVEWFNSVTGQVAIIVEGPEPDDYVIGVSSVTREIRELGQYELCEFSGLTDRNGVDICEGDIVRTTEFSIVETFIVRFGTTIVPDNERYGDNTVTGFYRERINPEDYDLWNGKCDDHMEDATQLEVIGSIYSTPELLTQTKE